MKITVREASIYDIDTTVKIISETWKNSFSHFVSKATVQNYSDATRIKPMVKNWHDDICCHLYLASLNDDICGHLMWRYPSEIQYFAEIATLFVTKIGQGKGIADTLLKNATHDMLKNRVNTAFLWVFKDNIRAINFYKKKGFYHDGKKLKDRFDNAVELRYRLTLSK